MFSMSLSSSAEHAAVGVGHDSAANTLAGVDSAQLVPIADASPAIHAMGLSKHFGDTVAVESLSLTVRRGEVFGFLGPNGAGKTTVVKMLLGLVRPSAGQVMV